MDYGNIVYALAFATLGIVVALLVFSFIKTKRKQKKTEHNAMRETGRHHEGRPEPGRH